MYENSVETPTEKSVIFFDPKYNDYVRWVGTGAFRAVDDGRTISYSAESAKRLYTVAIDCVPTETPGTFSLSVSQRSVNPRKVGWTDTLIWPNGFVKIASAQALLNKICSSWYTLAMEDHPATTSLWTEPDAQPAGSIWLTRPVAGEHVTIGVPGEDTGCLYYAHIDTVMEQLRRCGDACWQPATREIALKKGWSYSE